MDEWPGRWVDDEDVAAACGDERDWFQYQHRLKASRNIRDTFWEVRGRRRKLTSRYLGRGRKFEFAQIQIVGDVGASKSTLSVKEAAYWHERGHVVVTNGPALFGLRVEGSEIYTIVDRVPQMTVIIIDEAHSGLGGNLVQTIGYQEFLKLCAGIRKKQCRLILPTAMAEDVGRRIREMTSEVWEPVKPTIARRDYGYRITQPPHSDPANFVLCWQIWHGFPFREHRYRSKFPKADDIRLQQGEPVRRAFLCTDSFMPLDTFTGDHARREAMDEYREQQNQQNLTAEHQTVLMYLARRLQDEEGPPTYIHPETVSFDTGIEKARLGRVMLALFGDVDDMQARQGYRMEKIGPAMMRKFRRG